ncbi:MAG: 30S ribosomal protein S17 [Nanoarchaeota archaeon]|nr:30S ribosomal protein S17 [Nanoarchaeota archaeon]
MNNKKSYKQEKKEKMNTKENNTSVSTAFSSRGRAFEGVVTKKFPTRIVVEFERIVHMPKYERFYKKKSRLHAKLPKDLNVEVGDYVLVRECRPLSKIIHFILIKKIRSSTEAKNEVN